METYQLIILQGAFILTITQLIKKQLVAWGVTTDFTPFTAMTVGGIFGFCTMGFSLAGLGWGIVAGAMTAGGVSYLNEKDERAKNPAVTINTPVVKSVEEAQTITTDVESIKQ